MLDVDFREFLFLRLSEKGYEQRSDREFCWYTEDEMDRKAPPLAVRRARLQAPPRLFGQSLWGGSENSIPSNALR